MRNSLFICLRRTGTGSYAKTQQCVSQHNGRVNFILADCLYKNKKVLLFIGVPGRILPSLPLPLGARKLPASATGGGSLRSNPQFM